MSLLITGIVVWSLTHLFPAILPATRDGLVRKLGENPYRGLFALVILGSLILIVLGWRQAVPSALYAPPFAANPVISVLILIAFILFFAAGAPGNIKRFVRHPQMVGTMLWGVAHLLTNGSTRAVALFGGLTIWAIVEVLMCNRRDGKWQKPEPAALRLDVIPVVIGSVLFAAVLYFHGSLFGVPAIPG
ncbi:MAG: NnrU family protein [Gammaproteobacteria bacterium]|nr:NnrU family protein [Gammaproteobacteria bacterium]MBT8110198.1 NnrU family protein [Gammaproteobacteria bacterium]NND48548.1 NnrU family protein [Woeseiaceae bacterium]NNL44901.1 NnrU family protein [Woeseiaceae bacterium]